MDKIKILLVDDLPENLLALEALLKNPTVEFFRATSGMDALELLLRQEFALAIIDVQMPEMDGFELAELMRGTDRTRTVPIIFVTAGVRDRTNTFLGYDKGAVDFLHKPLETHIVKSKVQVFIDLALQKRLLQNQLEETKRLLRERDDALQSRDEFLSIASHELKTPLTSLHLQLQTMSRTLEKPEVHQEAKIARLEKGLTVCTRQSSKLAALLDELLDLTRIRLGKLTLSRERTDLFALSREVADRFQPEATSHGGELRLIGVGPIIGDWDPTRVEQIVTNLVSNAIKYGGGKPAEIRLSQSSDGKVAEIEIRDQGIGIPDEMLDKIFLRFERAIEGKAISGLGLGLYITRQIVEAHGGVITVDSQVSRGSTFRVELPMANSG
jgi:signal transduction histidine kinase